MHRDLIELGLRRAGFQSLEEFMHCRGIRSQDAALELLMPWILGYDLWRVQEGDTYAAIARATGSSVRAITVANPEYDPESLPVGTYLVVPYSFPVVPEDTPVTWQLTHYVLRGLQARYPFLGMDTIGRSAGGRPLERVSLGRGRRVVYYNASHHANEWITTWVALSCLEQLAQAAAYGRRILDVDPATLMQTSTLYLTPLVNPDGVDLLGGMVTEQELAAAQEIAAAYPDIPFPSGWKANLRGVDLNLNYPAQWDQAKQIKYDLGFTAPAPRDFVGEAPLSERESRAMFDSTEALDPALVMAFHAQGREIYWKFQDKAPQGARALGYQMAMASGYRLEEVPYAAGYAGYKDWFIQDFDRPGFTVEAGEGENPLPLSQLGEMVRANLPIFLLGISGGDPNYVPPEEPKPEPEPEPAPERPAPAPVQRPQTHPAPGWG